MTDQTVTKRNKLSHEILGLLGVSFAIAMFLFQFLSMTATSMVNSYYDRVGGILSEDQLISMENWIGSVSLLTAVLFFVVLFLFLLGQKLSYIRTLTAGVEALQTHRMDRIMPLEGNNELTQLAETINFLSLAEKEMQAKERALQEEKEQFIRTLSHDIRTPLTSILSYSEYLLSHGELPPEECREQLALIRKKAGQIKDLTDILLSGGQRNPEEFENVPLLMEQLAAEAEEALEDDFQVVLEMPQCPVFSGTFDLGELQRIFDNLVSNIKKYAAPGEPVLFQISREENGLLIRQTNAVRKDQPEAESYQMGLKSIRRIALNYGGNVDVALEQDRFEITILLSEF